VSLISAFSLSLSLSLRYTCSQVDCDSGLEDAIRSEIDRERHAVQLQRVSEDPHQAAKQEFATSLTEHESTAHGPWAASLVTSWQEQEAAAAVVRSGGGATTALHVTRRRVEALTNNLKVEAGQDIVPRPRPVAEPKPPDSATALPGEEDLTPLQRARRRLEAMQSRAEIDQKSHESGRVQQGQTIGWEKGGSREDYEAWAEERQRELSGGQPWP